MNFDINVTILKINFILYTIVLLLGWNHISNKMFFDNQSDAGKR